MENDPVIAHRIVEDTQKIEMTCDIVHSEGNVMYDVEWYVNDDLVQHDIGVTNMPAFVTDDKLKIDSNVSMLLEN